MGVGYKPCAAPSCHQLVLIRSRTDRPRCPEHRYPEKVIRGRMKAEAAAVVRGRACVLCGAPASEADHVVPLSQGGDPWAMVPLCRPCHVAKTAQEKRASQR